MGIEQTAQTPPAPDETAPMNVITLVLGPVATNTYLLADPETKDAAVIDPAWDGQMIAERARRAGWYIRQVWVTHAHFDHFGGTAALLAGLSPAPSLALHSLDLPLWRAQGGAPLFGMRLDATPDPDISLQHGQILRLGSLELEVRHAPGHSAGHVVFYCAAHKTVFCGDVIFEDGVGRTDLPGGDHQTLIESIRAQILSLPDETRLLPGHGPATSVGRERGNFLWL